MQPTRTLQVAFLLLALAALVVTISRLNIATIRAALEAMSWRWAAIATAMNLLAVLVDATRWTVIVSAIRPVSFLSTIQAQLIGIVANVIFPFKLGEGARALALAAREKLSAATAITTVLVDRVLDASTLPLFVTLAGTLMPLPPDVLRYRRWIVAVLVATVAGGVAARFWVRRKRVARAKAQHLPERLLDRVVSGLRVLDQKHHIALTIGVALCAWLLRAAIIWCMFAAFNLDLPASAAVSVVALLNLSIAIVATPGNVGTFELATVGALALWDVPPEIGMSIGIAMHVLEVVPPALLGLIAVTT